MTVETICLDGGLLQNREQAMEALEKALCLPEWWGRNLDALHDCLTDLDRPIRLELRDRELMETTRFGRTLLRVLRDSVSETPWLELEAD